MTLEITFKLMPLLGKQIFFAPVSAEGVMMALKLNAKLFDMEDD